VGCRVGCSSQMAPRKHQAELRMKERPILFNGEMVRAILDGRKTMTRRPVKPQPPASIDSLHGGKLRSRAPYELSNDNDDPCGFGFQDDQGNYWIPPLGTIGDQLWVRETWAPHCEMLYTAIYRCDRGGDYQDTVSEDFRWRPSIHMPRWASRITLEITGVRVERVQEMEGMDAASSDALKEGVHRIHHEGGNYYYSAFRNQPDPKNWTDPCLAFKELWQSIYSNWDANPWVWVYEFRRIKP